LLGADAAVVRLLEDDELVVSAVGGSCPRACSNRVRRPPAGPRRRDPDTCAGRDRGRRRRWARRFGPCASRRLPRVLAVPLVGSEGGTQGPCRLRQAAAHLAARGVEALAALAGNAFRRARERGAIPARCPREGAERRHPRQHRRRDRGRRPRGSRRALERGGERITGVRASDAIGRSTEQVLQRTLASGDDTERGDRLLAIRRGDEDVWLSLTEAIMRDPAGAVAGGSSPQGHLGRAGRRADEVRLRHRGLTRAANAADLDLRLRRDAAPPRRALRRGGARTFLGYIASESDRLTTIVDQLLTSRGSTPATSRSTRTDRCQGVVSEVVQTAEQRPAANGTTSSSIFRSSGRRRGRRRQAEADPLEPRDNAIKFSPKAAG